MLTALLLLVGCTDAEVPDDVITLDEPAEDDGGDLPVAPAPDGQAGTGDAPDAADDDDPGSASCSPAQRSELSAAVDGQLDAIAEREWDRAVRFSTPSFRADIGADGFRDIILEGFPVVAGVTARDIGRCTVSDDGDEATMVVTVEDGDGVKQPLLYLFELGPEGWGIGGALPGDGAGSDPGEPTITT